MLLRIVALGIVAALGVGNGAQAVTPTPAAPVDLLATNGTSSISLAWTQPVSWRQPVSFRVYEGSTIVARNSTTHVTITGLGFSTTHTYTVTAVDAAGRESAPSAPVTRRVWIGGAPPTCESTLPTNPRVTAVTSSAVSLAWTPSTSNDATGPVTVYEGTTAVARSGTRSARVSGLTPSSTHVYRLGVHCHGQLVLGAPVTATTTAGPAPRLGAPTAPVVAAHDHQSVSLAWTPVEGAAGYVVYEGANPVAATRAAATTIRRLYRDTAHVYTVVARDSGGAESPASAAIDARTATCEPRPPRPVASVTALSPSTVALSWIQTSESTEYTVYEGAVPVASSLTPSAVVSGLASGSTHRFTVAATLTGACGQVRGRPVAIATPAGAAARPSTPLDFRYVSGRAIDMANGSVTLAWTQPASADPVTSYRLYEGATLVATSSTTSVTLILPGATTHRLTVAAVDAAGHESVQSNALTFSVLYFPPP